MSAQRARKLGGMNPPGRCLSCKSERLLLARSDPDQTSLVLRKEDCRKDFYLALSSGFDFDGEVSICLDCGFVVGRLTWIASQNQFENTAAWNYWRALDWRGKTLGRKLRYGP